MLTRRRTQSWHEYSLTCLVTVWWQYDAIIVPTTDTIYVRNISLFLSRVWKWKYQLAIDQENIDWKYSLFFREKLGTRNLVFSKTFLRMWYIENVVLIAVQVHVVVRSWNSYSGMWQYRVSIEYVKHLRCIQCHRKKFEEIIKIFFRCVNNKCMNLLFLFYLLNIFCMSNYQKICNFRFFFWSDVILFALENAWAVLI